MVQKPSRTLRRKRPIRGEQADLPPKDRARVRHVHTAGGIRCREKWESLPSPSRRPPRQFGRNYRGDPPWERFSWPCPRRTLPQAHPTPVCSHVSTSAPRGSAGLTLASSSVKAIAWPRELRTPRFRARECPSTGSRTSPDPTGMLPRRSLQRSGGWRRSTRCRRPGSRKPKRGNPGGGARRASVRSPLLRCVCIR